MSAISFCQYGVEKARGPCPIGAGDETPRAAGSLPARLLASPSNFSADAGIGPGPTDAPEGRGLFAAGPGEGGATPLGDGVARAGCANGGGPPTMGGSSLGSTLPRGGVLPNALPLKKSGSCWPFFLSATSSMSGRRSPSPNRDEADGRNGRKSGANDASACALEGGSRRFASAPSRPDDPGVDKGSREAEAASIFATPPSTPCPALSCRKLDDAAAANIFPMPPSKLSAVALGGLFGGAGPADGNCPEEFRKIGGGVTQAEAGIFS